jgi:hypothetical protein
VDNQWPVISLASAGSGATPRIEDTAKRAKMELNTVSMDQGREELAENFIAHSKAKGECFLLQNCHLQMRHMETLFEMYKVDALNAALAKAEAEKEPEKQEGGEKKPDKNKEAIRVTHEDHSGSASALSNLAFAIDVHHTKMIDAMESSEWCRLICILAFFNPMVQERRKFGPLG